MAPTRPSDVLEDDARGEARDLSLRLRATVSGERLRLDFAGTDPQIGREPQLPALGDQVGRAVRGPGPHRSRRAALGRRLPAGRDHARREGCLLNARPPAAVAAGNVETSSRVADLVLAALGEARGGPGAGPGHDEQPHPLGGRLHLLRDDRRRPGRLPGRATGRARSTWRCRTRSTPRSRRSSPSSRCGSASSACAAAAAGSGEHPGGEGIVREIEALEPMRFTLITERRRHPPRGRAAGATAAPGVTC